jgi:hypothetical protein
MFVKITFAILILMAAVIWIGVIQDRNNSLSTTLRGCTQTSDNSGYIGFECPDAHYYIPASERGQLKGISLTAEQK